ncbi:MAG: AMP-binding protein [Actinomycetota bacterium]|nr:AMP-binding protein [Actinomycetota bacterium]
MTDWNYADLFEIVADQIPTAPALVHGERRQTWAETEARANGLAASLLATGVAQQDKIAHYLYNCPEYMESTVALLKVGLVPVNTNYRYGDDELAYLWENADAVGVIFHGTFAERVERLRGRVKGVRTWIWVDDGTGPCPEWAVPYESMAGTTTGRVAAPWGRSGDDLYLLYTGGTTGMPKGVMWRQDDLVGRLNAASPVRFDESKGLQGVRDAMRSPGPSLLPACPLMHGTGAFTSLNVLSTGGSVVTLPGRHFDPVALLDAVVREHVNVIVIVGDAFAKPILAALDASPGRWDLSSVFAMISSGVMWSEEVKEGLFRHHPTFLAVDAFSSSEAIGMGTSVSSGAETAHTAEFRLGDDARVLLEDGRDVTPGSGEVGVLALGGRNPLGYYKDETKTAGTFRVIGGRRYVVPGDFATVDSDGAVHLLGRGSVCINTGGEKVYPEEVEEAVKLFPGVADAAVVGLPDERWGETVCAVVEPADGARIDERALVADVKAKLASYKAPRYVHVVASIARSPSGKLDYGRLRSEAMDWAAGRAAP